MAITLLLVDDQSIILDGLEALLGQDSGMRVLGRASNGAEAVELAKALQPDVVVMDISMPVMDGIEAARALLKCCPHVRVLVLSMYDHPDLVREIMDAGASGYVLKNVGRDELSLALRTVAGGRLFLGKQVQEVLDKDDRIKEDRDQPATNVLTKREREVVKMICMEHTTAEIAAALFISSQTVDTHRKNIMHKLSAKNTAGIVKYAKERGWC